jgi:hypothetical protein
MVNPGRSTEVFRRGASDKGGETRLGANGIRAAEEGRLALNRVRQNLPSQLGKGAVGDEEKTVHQGPTRDANTSDARRQVLLAICQHGHPESETEEEDAEELRKGRTRRGQWGQPARRELERSGDWVKTREQEGKEEQNQTSPKSGTEGLGVQMALARLLQKEPNLLTQVTQEGGMEEGEETKESDMELVVTDSSRIRL